MLKHHGTALVYNNIGIFTTTKKPAKAICKQSQHQKGYKIKVFSCKCGGFSKLDLNQITHDSHVN